MLLPAMRRQRDRRIKDAGLVGDSRTGLRIVGWIPTTEYARRRFHGARVPLKLTAHASLRPVILERS